MNHSSLKSFCQLALTGLLTLSPAASMANPVDAVVPLPAQVETLDGSFALNSTTSISGSSETAEQLTAAFKKYHQLSLKSAHKAGDIQLKLDTQLESELGNEGYQLTVQTDGITIQAASETGLFYGGMTLVQMVDTDSSGMLDIPAVKITDQPRFGWRGIMLDEGRHFQGKEFVYELLDNMALRKMNRFHWHLTEDEGWRVEIKGYPQLTEIGAWRGEGTQMPRVKWLGKNDPHEPYYGGYYTQEELKDIVAYAKKLHIEVIPEIDMPGHTNALIVAMPELGVTDINDETLAESRKKYPKLKNAAANLEASGDSNTAYRNNIMSVVREENYAFCGEIFDQLTEIFPFPYWHIGGDEVRTLYWAASPSHQKVMEEKGFTDLYQLQNMFLLRMEDMLRERGRTMIGWNEIMKGGEMSNDTVIMGWLGTGPGIKAAKEGYPTVMAPAGFTYFDMGYPGKGERKAHGWAGEIDAKRSYSWDPEFPDQLTPEERKNVLGIQACLWTEYVPAPEDASYKIWPRGLAIAEVGWTPQPLRNWDGFQARFENNLEFLDTKGIFYRVAPPKPVLAKGEIRIESGHTGGEIRYSTDGSDPLEGKVYQGQALPVELAGTLKTVTVRPNDLHSIIVEGAARPIHAEWKLKANLKEPHIIKIDATEIIDASGTWQIHFTPDSRHWSPVFVQSLIVRQGGNEVSKATLGFKTDAKNASISFSIKKTDEPVEIEVGILPVFHESWRTHGTITIDRN